MSLARLPRVGRVGVVVPARDEQDLLPGCLDSIRRAAARLSREHAVAVSTVVVLDRCVDASAEVVDRYPDMTALVIDAGNVGAARAAGCVELLRAHAPAAPSTLWLACTDADSRVPEDWLVRQVQLADEGAEVVLGTVTVDDWTGHPDHVAQKWRATYDNRDGHSHVHGANVGCRADAYLAAGGFPGLSLDEDVALVGALAGRVIRRVGDIAVVTSARMQSRTSGGFATFLAQLG
jgi:glycosyltransferase involved in cell wall biosynthesis